jgi:general secretion pathway protein M
MTLAPRTSKLLAVALLVGAVALGYELIFAPLMQLYASRQAQITLLATRAGRIIAQSRDVPALKAELGGLAEQTGHVVPFWPGATDAVAAASLQERVKSLLQSEDTVIGSAEVLPPTVEGGVHKITLKVRFDGEIDQVERVVHAVETMSPALMVDHLTIRNSEVAQSSAPPLSVELQVSGLAIGGGTARSSS